MDYIYLSHPLSELTPTFGNRDKFELKVNSSIRHGHTSNSYSFTFSSNHLGTHIDLPNHFYDNGKRISDILPAEWIFNRVQIVSVPCDDAKLIDIYDMDGMIDENVELLLIKTGFQKYRSTEKYWNENPGISPQLAIYLKNTCSNLRCIGFDFISLTSWKFRNEGKEAHKILLGSNERRNPIFIIEDMSLQNVFGDIINVIALPLVVEHADSSPVTVLCQIGERNS